MDTSNPHPRREFLLTGVGLASSLLLPAIAQGQGRVRSSRQSTASHPNGGLAAATVADFAPLVGQTFWVASSAGSEAMALVLLSAQAIVGRAAIRPAGRKYRGPFSIMFAGPDAPRLPQDTYTLSNATLGTFRLLLVPIGPITMPARYEAVFG